METGTFPKITENPDSEGNALGSQMNPIRPDFSSLGYQPVMWESVGGETATTMTVRYQTQ